MMQLKLVNTARRYETFSRHFRHVWPQYSITFFQTVITASVVILPRR